MSSTPPGWYPDPSGRPGQRYFDGSRWTEQVNASMGGLEQPQGRSGVPNWVWAVAIALSLIAAIGVAVAVFKAGPPMPSDSDASTALSNAPARSALLPELQLPAGTTQRDYESTWVSSISDDSSTAVDVAREPDPTGCLS